MCYFHYSTMCNIAGMSSYSALNYNILLSIFSFCSGVQVGTRILVFSGPVFKLAAIRLLYSVIPRYV